jgi:hypothetical protein
VAGVMRGENNASSQPKKRLSEVVAEKVEVEKEEDEQASRPQKP